jgi:GTP cyclohydrolase I
MSCDGHDHEPKGKLPVPDDVQEAIRTLIRWSGDDPAREGLLDTPSRVARAWREYCQGYNEDPAYHLSRQFEEVGGYNELVCSRTFRSSHIANTTWLRSPARRQSPICRAKVVGISKLARVLHAFARRLQIQERLTARSCAMHLGQPEVRTAWPL